MRLVDVLLAFPHYVLVIAIVGSLGPGIANLYLAFALVVWISFARIVRAEVLVARRAEYAQAARLLGYGHARVMLRHILPNVITPAIVFMMSDVVLTILAVTSLGFLGLGIQPPTPEWGLMIAIRGFPRYRCRGRKLQAIHTNPRLTLTGPTDNSDNQPVARTISNVPTITPSAIAPRPFSGRQAISPRSKCQSSASPTVPYVFGC
jgi:hypothetical protein